MLILGIDPGIAICGIAILQQEKGKQTLVHHEAITTPPTLSLSLRLLKIYESLTEIIEKFHPDCASVESLFFNTNAKTALVVGQARGVVMLTLAQKNIPITEYTPLQVKMALTGYGRADKNQIQVMVQKILNLPHKLTPDDVADAAAIALTHCFSYRISKQITDNR